MKTASPLTLIAASFLHLWTWGGQVTNVEMKHGKEAWQRCDSWEKHLAEQASPLELSCITKLNAKAKIKAIEDKWGTVIPYAITSKGEVIIPVLPKEITDSLRQAKRDAMKAPAK